MLVLQATYGASTGEPISKPRYVPFTAISGVLIEEAEGYWLLSPMIAVDPVDFIYGDGGDVVYVRSKIPQYIIDKMYGDVEERMAEGIKSIRRLDAVLGEER
jgi:hypothetical protein